mmetsp:Transcript_20391/g.3315  ORF Transcript_20391/g.3315 Transcript_20391/m.3315 type:complete len:88 (+) Transcript_20391:11-274(+)
MEEESIYNLIPREYVPPPKPARYRSKYPPNTVPSASTFGLHTTSKVLNNVEGNYDHFAGAHDHRGMQNTLGKVKGSAVARPTEFRRK